MSTKKKLMAASAAYVLGLSPNVRVKGDRQQAVALRGVLGESRKLYLSLRSNAKNSAISEILETKQIAAKRFQESFGYNWPF